MSVSEHPGALTDASRLLSASRQPSALAVPIHPAAA
jgi:hypothetical protein